MKPLDITVVATFDEKVRRWYATSDDVSGLHVESDTLDELVSVIDDVLPDLVEYENGAGFLSVPYHLMHDRVAARG